MGPGTASPLGRIVGLCARDVGGCACTAPVRTRLEDGECHRRPCSWTPAALVLVSFCAKATCWSFCLQRRFHYRQSPKKWLVQGASPIDAPFFLVRSLHFLHLTFSVDESH